MRGGRGQGPLRPKKWQETAAVSGCEGRAQRAAGAATPPQHPWPLPPGVPGEVEQPAPELVEVEVGSTALLKCGPSHSRGNVSHVDWFSVRAWTREGSRGKRLLPSVVPGCSLPLCTSPQVHKEKPTLIFRVRQGQGQSEPGDYQHRLSLQDRGTTLALTHVTPHDERVFLCQGKRPRSQEHRVQLRVYSECPFRPRGRRAPWEGWSHAPPHLSPLQKLRRSRVSKSMPWVFP